MSALVASGWGVAPARSLREWLRGWSELRIDVVLPGDALERQLEQLHERLQSGERLPARVLLPPLVSGFLFHYRESDGEFFVYVVEAATGRLAGYTVFNRLTELAKRAGPFLRAPHSRYARRYQGRGLATAVYQWALGAGLCLLSGPRQSPAAYRLWLRLRRGGHHLDFVQLLEGRLRWLGPEVDDEVLERFDTRMLLFGCGWDWPALARATGA